MEADRPKRKNPRLKEYDYGTPGYYFVTVNARERGTDLFAHLVPGDPVLSGDDMPYDSHMAKSEKDAVRAGHRAGPPSVQLTPIGELIEHHIKEIDKHYSNAYVDIYAIMPDHVHMIIVIRDPGDGPARCPALTAEGEAYLKENHLPKASLLKIMNAFKAITSIEAGFPLWQRSFFDHILRTDEDLLNTRSYIHFNASKHYLNQLKGHDTNA